jgi:hypothetical protein
MGIATPQKMLRPPGRLRDPDYWRNRAEEVRVIAERMRDVYARDTLLRVAEKYEEFADMATRRRNAKGSLPDGQPYLRVRPD